MPSPTRPPPPSERRALSQPPPSSRSHPKQEAPSPSEAEPVQDGTAPEPLEAPDAEGLELEVAVDTDDSMPIETAEEVEVPDQPFAELHTEMAERALVESALEPGALEVASASSDAAAAEPQAAAARSELPPPAPAETSPAFVAAPPAVSLLPSPPAARPTAWSSRLATAKQRLVSSLPPRAVQIARQYPVLWLVAAPVFFATVLIGIVVAMQPPTRLPAARPQPTARMAIAPAAAATDARAPAAASHDSSAERAAVSLSGRDPASLNIDEVLLLNDNRVERKRADARALSQKLQAQPELARDPAIQTQLLRFAADPDTAADALVTMARAPAPVGPDLLYGVWTSRASVPGTAELARSLLHSREVRPAASPALAVALALREADTCDAVRAALGQTPSDGDERAMPALVELSLGRGCGNDCLACVRSSAKQLVASIKAIKRRRAPRYPSLKAR